MIVLLAHNLRANAGRTAVIGLGLAIWGAIMPIVYATFGSQLRTLFDSGIIPPLVVQFMGGNVLTLPNTIALGVIHPIAVFLKALMPVGFALYAVAGERQRGTLEVILARPIDRRAVHAAALIGVASFAAVVVGAEILGTIAGAAMEGQAGDLNAANLAFLWLDGWLLYLALGAIALAASISLDRLAPAATATLVFLVVSYVFEILAELWPDAAGLGPWSIFHYLDARAILAGLGDPADLGVLAAATAVAVTYGQLVFPGRDLAAPA
jgi:ABC-2 type transport system permease protein